MMLIRWFLFFAMLLLLPIVADAEQVYRWRHIGERPMCDSIENATRKLQEAAKGTPDAFSDEERELLQRELARSTISRAALQRLVNEATLPQERFEAQRKLDATCFQFFFWEYLDFEKFPPEILERAARAADRTAYRRTFLKKGSVCRGMAFSTPVVVQKNVLWDPAPSEREGEPLVAIFTFRTPAGDKDREFMIPPRCDNLCYQWEEIPLKAVAVAPKPKTLEEEIREGMRKFTPLPRGWVNFWVAAHLPSPETEVLDAATGLQSRDAKHLEPHRKKGSHRTLYAGRGQFTFKLRGITGDGRQILVNNEMKPFPRDVQVTLSEVAPGLGRIAMPREWVKADAGLGVVKPEKFPPLHYPRSGELNTCPHPNCGQWREANSELYYKVFVERDRGRQPDHIFFHFALFK